MLQIPIKSRRRSFKSTIIVSSCLNSRTNSMAISLFLSEKMVELVMNDILKKLLEWPTANNNHSILLSFRSSFSSFQKSFWKNYSTTIIIILIVSTLSSFLSWEFENNWFATVSPDLDNSVFFYSKNIPNHFLHTFVYFPFRHMPSHVPVYDMILKFKLLVHQIRKKFKFNQIFRKRKKVLENGKP